MRNSCQFIVKRYQREGGEDLHGNLEEVIEVNLPRDYDFSHLQEYLESEQAFPLTNSYYTFNRIYSSTNMGAGGASEMLILEIWNKIPEEIKGILLIKIIGFGVSLPRKIKKTLMKRKANKKDKDYVEERYGLSVYTIETIELKKMEIKINIYKKKY